MVIIELANGKKIELELYPDIAPNTVKNFLYLADQGFYNGLVFHRVIKDFMIQGGCPDGTGMGGPGYCIAGEFAGNGFNNTLRHSRGVISMARAMSNNSGGSQFFIMHQNGFFLDGQYAAFGRVINGMDVVDEIAETRVGANDKPKIPHVIKTITLVDEGEIEEPEKC